MFSRRAASSFRWPLQVAILVLAWATPAVAAPTYPLHPELSEKLKARISVAARDSALQSWQREFMLGMVKGGGPGQQSGTPELHGGDRSSVLRSTPGSGRVAIYDTVRDRLLVLGGYDDFGPRNDLWTL